MLHEKIEHFPDSFKRITINDGSCCIYEVFSVEHNAMMNCQNKVFRDKLCEEHWAFAKGNGLLKSQRK